MRRDRRKRPRRGGRERDNQPPRKTAPPASIACRVSLAGVGPARAGRASPQGQRPALVPARGAACGAAGGAALPAYHPDRQLRDRVKAALATLTTQGRAVGFCVIAALQDPRKEVMSIRNLFPDRIAMRLDEPEQVDMVLG